MLVVKNPPANAGDVRDSGSIPGSGRFPGGGQATHSIILAWRIPWTEEPGWLQSGVRVPMEGGGVAGYDVAGSLLLCFPAAGSETLSEVPGMTGPGLAWKEGLP